MNAYLWNPPAAAGLVYLSMPYSHPDPRVRGQRMQAFWSVAGELAAEGVFVVSPMTMEPALRMQEGHLEMNWETWERYSKAVLDACAEIWVLRLPGWEESVGVAGEIKYARQRAIRVRYLDIEGRRVVERAEGS